MSDAEFTNIVIKIIFAILSVLLTTYILPFMNELTSRYKNEKFEKFVIDSVKAAEQVVKGSGKGTVKKEKVLTAAIEQLKKYNINISEEELDTLIESVVFTMNHSEEFVK